MIEELPSELQSQIEQEAKDRSMGFENKGTGFIVRTEYALGAEKYAFKWQEAERRAERYEKALKEIRDMDHISSDAYAMKLKAYWALTPKKADSEK